MLYNHKAVILVFYVMLWCLNSSLVLDSVVPEEPTAENKDPSKEPVKKKQKGQRGEAASKQLIAVGHKIKQVFISGWAGYRCWDVILRKKENIVFPLVQCIKKVEINTIS